MEDWSLLFGQSLAYLSAEPWTRWSDEVPLGLELTVDGAVTNYVAIVMGNAGVQRGLALYPGMALPAGLRSPGPELEPEPALEATPSGTLLLLLDPPGETQVEFADKALRYGWPPEAAYLPTFIGVGPDGPSELAGADAQLVQVGLAAVIALDSRGPVLVEATKATTGQVALAEGAQGHFAISQRLPAR